MASETATMEMCNCFALRSAARHVTQFYDQLLAGSGLRTTQFAILARLKRDGPLMINALAKAMVMDRTTLGRNILPLERDGLLRIAAAAGDRRAKELHLTSAGERRLHAARRGWVKAQEAFETAFGAERAATLRAALRAVVATELGPRERDASR
jgi:DNA-binding MarR family transcriptional regulator